MVVDNLDCKVRAVCLKYLSAFNGTDAKVIIICKQNHYDSGLEMLFLEFFSREADYGCKDENRLNLLKWFSTLLNGHFENEEFDETFH